jgi:uncharacterized membrane protein
MEVSGSPDRRARVWQIVLLGIIALGIMFRGIQLDRKVYWVDEAFTSLRVSGYNEAELLQYMTQNPIVTAQELLRFQSPSPEKSPIDTVKGLAIAEPQLPPLYFLLVRSWAQMFGASVSAMRSFSAVASMLSLALVYALMQELFASQRVALTAVALLAVSPFQVLYAQEARPYSLWLLTVMTMSWLLLRSLRRKHWQDWLGYTIAAVLSLYTFVYSLLVIAGQALYVLWRAQDAPKSLKAYLIATGLAIAAFLPWLGWLVTHWAQVARLASWQTQSPIGGWWERLLTWGLNISRGFVDFNTSYEAAQSIPWLLLIAAIVALVAYALWHLHQAASPQASWFVLALIAPLALGLVGSDLLQGGQRSLVPRYAAVCFLGITLSMGFLLSKRSHPSQPSRYQGLWRIVLASLLAAGILSCANSALAETWWNKLGGYIPPAARIINQSERPLVISDRTMWALSLAHHLQPNTAIQFLTQRDRPPTLPPGYSQYFLFSTPPEFAQQVAQAGYRVAPLPNLEGAPIWEIGS